MGLKEKAAIRLHYPDGIVREFRVDLAITTEQEASSFILEVLTVRSYSEFFQLFFFKIRQFL